MADGRATMTADATLKQKSADANVITSRHLVAKGRKRHEHVAAPIEKNWKFFH